MNFPQWATPERRAHLVELAQATLAAYDLGLFTSNLVNPVIEEVIVAWKADDRVLRIQLWKLEQRRLHAMPKLIRRGPFGTLDREIYLANRPLFEIRGIGIGAFTFKRVAQVEIPGLRRVIWVDLSGIRPEGVSKNRLRKLVRYGRGSAPKDMVAQIEARVVQAIKRVL